MYLGLQDGKKGETFTCVPSPSDMLYISSCSDSELTVGGACAKCIVGTVHQTWFSSSFSLSLHCVLISVVVLLLLFVQRIAKMSVLVWRGVSLQEPWYYTCCTHTHTHKRAHTHTHTALEVTYFHSIGTDQQSGRDGFHGKRPSSPHDFCRLVPQPSPSLS